MNTDERDALRSQLRTHEGVRFTLYTDSRGVPTIGIGRNVRDKGISRVTAEQMLDEDIDECLADLQTFGWFGNLDRVRLRAVIDLRFNLGRGTFRTFAQFLAAMARKDYAAAAHELENSQWARQVAAARRDRIVTQIRDGRDA